MAVEFRMPKLGLTMEQGEIVEWLVDEGAQVEPGAPVLVIETDKAVTEVEAPGAGRLHRIGEPGATFDCGEVVAWLLADGEEAPAAPTTAAAPPAAVLGAAAPRDENGGPAHAVATGSRLLSSPNARRVAGQAGVDLRLVRGTGPRGRIVSEDVEELLASGGGVAPTAQSAPAARQAGTPVLATFAARALADLLGIDIAAVPATSRDGRIGRDDVAAHVRGLLAEATREQAAPARPTAPVLAPASQTPTEVIAFKGMRGTIATRMHRALRDMVQLTLNMDVDMGAVAADRSARAAALDGARPPGYTDYVVAASARALRRHPIVNSQVVDDGIALLPAVHIGVAVASDKGVFVPVVRDADRLELTALAAETARLADAARAAKLSFDDLEGATFSVTALGMFGVDAFTPVINPPNSAILGVGRLRDDVAWDEEGRPVKARRMTLSLTWDHRVFDGAPAAEFCRTIVELLEAPSTLGA